MCDCDKVGRKKLGLVKRSYRLNAVAGATSNINDILPDNRGNIYAVDIKAQSDVIANLADNFATLIGNGVEIIINECLGRYGSFVGEDTRFYIELEGATEFLFEVVNNSAVDIPVDIVFYFEDYPDNDPNV